MTPLEESIAFGSPHLLGQGGQGVFARAVLALHLTVKGHTTKGHRLSRAEMSERNE